MAGKRPGNAGLGSWTGSWWHSDGDLGSFLLWHMVVATGAVSRAALGSAFSPWTVSVTSFFIPSVNGFWFLMRLFSGWVHQSYIVAIPPWLVQQPRQRSAMEGELVFLFVPSRGECEPLGPFVGHKYSWKGHAVLKFRAWRGFEGALSCHERPKWNDLKAPVVTSWKNLRTALFQIFPSLKGKGWLFAFFPQSQCNPNQG